MTSAPVPSTAPASARPLARSHFTHPAATTITRAHHLTCQRSRTCAKLVVTTGEICELFSQSLRLGSIAARLPEGGCRSRSPAFSQSLRLGTIAEGSADARACVPWWLFPVPTTGLHCGWRLCPSWEVSHVLPHAWRLDTRLTRTPLATPSLR